MIVSMWTRETARRSINAYAAAARREKAHLILPLIHSEAAFTAILKRTVDGRIRG